jgi:hypothetical protein
MVCATKPLSTKKKRTQKLYKALTSKRLTKRGMKTLGLTLILCSGVLVLLFLLIPVGIKLDIHAYPEQKQTINGQLRVAQLSVSNNGWFSQKISLPELTACVGDTEIPLDAWLANEGNVVPGVGQRKTITLRAGESGTIYYIARDSVFYDTMRIYEREPYFSCLNPGAPIS